MLHVVEQLVGQLDRRYALWAVPGPRERDEQGRDVLRQVRPWGGDQVGRRHGLDPPARGKAKTGGKDLAGEG